MLAKLEKDKLTSRVDSLEKEIEILHSELRMARGEEIPAKSGEQESSHRRTKDSTLPADNQVNPFLHLSFEPASISSLSLTKTNKAHTMSISRYEKLHVRSFFGFSFQS